MFVGANADEVPEIGGPPASITSSLAWVEADGAVARVVRHSHHPSKATIETRAMPNVSRARTRSAKPNPPRPSILLIPGSATQCSTELILAIKSTAAIRIRSLIVVSFELQLTYIAIGALNVVANP